MRLGVSGRFISLHVSFPECIPNNCNSQQNKIVHFSWSWGLENYDGFRSKAVNWLVYLEIKDEKSSSFSSSLPCQVRWQERR